VAINSREHVINRDKLLEVENYNQTFELVKYAVSAVFDMRRAGLSLILQGMPSGLGAYHILGSNVIVLNRFVLEIIKNTGRSIEEYNSYLFTVLAHEYLHSFGILEESTVRKMILELCKNFFGEDHPTNLLAKDPVSLFPQLRHIFSDKFENRFEIVKEFDKSNQYYIQ